MKEPKVIIAVEGGVVVNVVSNVHDLGVVIIDYDVMETWDDEEKKADKIRDFVHVQRVVNGNTATEFIEIY